MSAGAILFVVVIGAAPSIANGLISGIDQVPPLFTRAGRVLGARGLTAYRFVILPAALPSFLTGLKQGWAFAWRAALWPARSSPPRRDLGVGLGQLLENARTNSDMPDVLSAILLILVVGIGIELLVFRPVERRVLRSRGLLA